MNPRPLHNKFEKHVLYLWATTAVQSNSRWNPPTGSCFTHQLPPLCTNLLNGYYFSGLGRFPERFGVLRVLLSRKRHRDSPAARISDLSGRLDRAQASGRARPTRVHRSRGRPHRVRNPLVRSQATTGTISPCSTQGMTSVWEKNLMGYVNHIWLS